MPNAGTDPNGVVLRSDPVADDAGLVVRPIAPAGGLPVTIVGGGGGGGTEYVEDTPAPADPTAPAQVGRRRDVLGPETSTDGDWVIINSTNKGELYVKHADAIAAVQSGAWTVGVTGPVTVVDGGGSLSVDDGGGSLTVDGTVGVNNFPAVQPVSDNGGSLTVDGTVAVSNFPATQPVSGSVTTLDPDATTTGTLINTGDDVSIDNTNGYNTANIAWTQALSDQVFIAEGSVVDGVWFALPRLFSAALQSWATFDYRTIAPLATGDFVIQVNCSAWKRVRFRKTGGAGSTNNVEIRLSRSPALSVTVAPQMTKGLTFGTMGSGFYVQNIKDTGRTHRAWSARNVTPPAAGTDGLITLSLSVDGAAPSTGTSFAVSANKRLRLTNMTAQMVNGTTIPAQPCLFTLRWSATGAVTNTSPVLGIYHPDLIVSRPAASPYVLTLPEGMELDGTMQFGLTFLATTTAPTAISAMIYGMEY